MWPECSAAYHRYIAAMYKVEIIAPPLEIIPNILTKSHKRLTLKRILDDDITIYKIGNNYIKKIIRKNAYEYIVNDKYSLKTTDNLSDDELISLLFIY